MKNTQFNLFKRVWRLCILSSLFAVVFEAHAYSVVIDPGTVGGNAFFEFPFSGGIALDTSDGNNGVLDVTFSDMKHIIPIDPLTANTSVILLDFGGDDDPNLINFSSSGTATLSDMNGDTLPGYDFNTGTTLLGIPLSVVVVDRNSGLIKGIRLAFDFTPSSGDAEIHDIHIELPNGLTLDDDQPFFGFSGFAILDLEDVSTFESMKVGEWTAPGTIGMVSWMLFGLSCIGLMGWLHRRKTFNS